MRTVVDFGVAGRDVILILYGTYDLRREDAVHSNTEWRFTVSLQEVLERAHQAEEPPIPADSGNSDTRRRHFSAHTTKQMTGSALCGRS